MTESNHYYIKTVEDFLKFPAEKREDCLKDFMAWMQFSDVISRCTPNIVSNNQVFHWVDDDIRGISGVNITAKRAKKDD